MLIIIDKRMPAEARQKLQKYGDVLELHTSGIVYPTISGHPDIFFCQTSDGLVAAPNLPDEILLTLQNKKMKILSGIKSPGNTYPFTAHYNAVSGQRFLIHNLKYTDPTILKVAGRQTHIHVGQGYTRCNLISLNDEVFITSDPGIHKTLTGIGLNCRFFPAENIQLSGFDHGFIGGTCGIWNQKIFICGSLKHYMWGKAFLSLADSAGFQIIELADDLLQDVGSILFIDHRFS